MKTRFSRLFRFLSVLCLGVWALAFQLTAQTPLELSIHMNAGQAQLTVTGAVNSVCQIQWSDNLSSTSRWCHLAHCVLSSTPARLADSISSIATCRYYRAVWTPNTKMVWIPPGTFTMGSPTNELNRLDWEGPRTVVTLTKGFWMCRYEVTQAEYHTVMGSNPSYYTGSPQLPVEGEDWYEAAAYCETLTQQEKATARIPSNTMYRLPTEAEWEYACRAGTATRFSYGDDPSVTNLTNYAWYASNDTGTTHPVGQKLPNPWGLYDMNGNVWEWCQDGWSDRLPGGAVIDPQGASMFSLRVLRGGDFSNSYVACRSAMRNNQDPASRGVIGFRVVLASSQP